MALTIEGHGFVTELDVSPKSIQTSDDTCGALGFSFADFAYHTHGRAKVWVTGVQIGACLAPRGVRMRHDDRDLSLETDTIIARGPGSFSASEWDHGFDGRFFTFAPEAIERFFHQPLGRIAFRDRDVVVPAGERPVLRHLIDAVSFDLMAGSPGGPIFVESLSAAALRAFSESPPDPKRPARGLSSDQAKRARDLILTRSAEPISLVEIADAVDLSVGHMLRSFKITFGVTPHQYVIRQRVDCALRLLQDRTLSLDAVATKAGFGTKSQMARTFRTVLGIAPKDARD